MKVFIRRLRNEMEMIYMCHQGFTNLIEKYLITKI